MKKYDIRFLKYVVSACIFCGIIPVSVHSEETLIVSESFDSYTEGAELDWLEGGFGWTSEWAALFDGYLIPRVGRLGDHWAMKLSGTHGPPDGPTTIGINEVAYRSFPVYDDDEIFVSVTISYEGNPAFLAVWLDNTAGTGGTHLGGRLNLGMFSATSGAPVTLFSRIHISGEGHVIDSGVIAQPNTAYHLVVRLTKALPGPDGRFNKVDFWINPSAEDFETPFASTVTPFPETHGISWMNVMGVRISGFRYDSTYYIHNLILSKSWDDMPFDIPVWETPKFWAGYSVDSENRVDTGDFLGMLQLFDLVTIPGDSPWVLQESGGVWLFLKEAWVVEGEGFAFLPQLPRGDEEGEDSFIGYKVVNDWIETSMGGLYVANAPFVYSTALGKWLTLTDEGATGDGSWVFLLTAKSE